MMTLEGRHLTLAVGWTPGGYLWNTLRLTEGRLPLAGEENAVLLGQSAAEALSKKSGDAIRLREKTFTIVGIFRIGGVIGNNLTVLPLPVLQAMMGRQGKVTLFHIRIDRPQDPERMAAVRAQLQEAFANLSFVETSQVADNDMIIKLFRAIAWSISLIAIIIALVMVLNTLLMTVIERTREIGILAAIGWPVRRIVGLVVLEGIILALLGGAAGLALGIAGLSRLTALPVLKGIIEYEISIRLLVEILVAVAILGGFGSLYPAWRAARLDPVEALRYE
jgi:putative ABC transport system permease protein